MASSEIGRNVVLPSGRQGVADGQGREAVEVAIGRPQLAHPVGEADGSDASVVNARTDEAASFDQPAQPWPALPMPIFRQRDDSGTPCVITTAQGDE